MQSEIEKGNLPPYYSSGSPFVFICDNFERLYVPFPLSGQHKLWTLPKKIARRALPGLKKLPPLKELPRQRYAKPVSQENNEEDFFYQMTEDEMLQRAIAESAQGFQMSTPDQHLQQEMTEEEMLQFAIQQSLNM